MTTDKPCIPWAEPDAIALREEVAKQIDDALHLQIAKLDVHPGDTFVVALQRACTTAELEVLYDSIRSSIRADVDILVVADDAALHIVRHDDIDALIDAKVESAINDAISRLSLTASST